MGRDRNKELEKIIESVLLYLELDDFEKFQKHMNKLVSINVSNLSKEDAKILYDAINSIEIQLKSKQEELANKIKGLTEVKKFKTF